jgi:hypothetical protein
MRPRHRTVIARVVVPVLLAALVAAAIARGGDALPAFMANAAVRTGLGVETATRLLVASLASCALLAVLFGRLASGIAWVAFGGVAFVSLAELSAVFAAPGGGSVPARVWVVPMVGLALGVAGLWALNATVPAAGGHPPARCRLGAWQVLAGLCAVGVPFAVAAQLTVASRTVSVQGGVEYVDFDVSSWVGKTVPGTGLAKFLPMITPATLEGTRWIVFYQPSCGRCHDVFRIYFAGDQHGEVVAVEVPHAPDATVLESDQPADIECTNCARMPLPAGKHYVVTTPTIVKVENGVVTCVTSHDYDRCRPPSELAPAR